MLNKICLHCQIQGNYGQNEYGNLRRHDNIRGYESRKMSFTAQSKKGNIDSAEQKSLLKESTRYSNNSEKL